MSTNELHEFEKMIENYEKRLKSIQLKILILGPSKDNPDSYARDCYKKRVEIKNELIKNGHRAYFPEEIKEEAERRGKQIPNITVFEKSLADDCDLIIVIYSPKSHGVYHEVSVFCDIENVARKIWLFYAEDYPYESSWTLNDKIIFIKGNGGEVEPFTQEDIRNCSILRKIMDHVEEMRITYLLHPYRKYTGAT